MISQLIIKGLTTKPISNTMAWILGPHITIFMLHRPKLDHGTFDGTNPDVLEEALIYAKNSGFQFAYVDDVVNSAIAGIQPSRPTICFTLDDGYQDQLDILVPVLLRHQARPTMYVIADMISTQFWPWDAQLTYAFWHTPKDHISLEFQGKKFSFPLESSAHRTSARRKVVRLAKQLSSVELGKFYNSFSELFSLDLSVTSPQFRPATWDSLRKAESDGLAIGSHACSHRVFSSLSEKDITDELIRSKEILNQNIKNPAKVFCFPSGTESDFSLHHEKLVSDAGFTAALSSIPGNIRNSDIASRPYAIHRHSFPNNINQFIRYSSWIEYIRSYF